MLEMKKKILFIHHGVGIGGAPISMIKTIKHLDSEKYDAEVLLIKDSNLTTLLEKENIKYTIVDHPFYKNFYQFYPHIIPSYLKWYQIFKIFIFSYRWILSRYFFSKKILSKFDADIIHLNSSVLSDFLYASSLKSKVVIHIREPIASGYLGLRRAFFKNQINKYSDQIIAISSDNKKRLGLIDKTEVVYNFIEVDENRVNHIEMATRKVLYLGGMDEAKGFFTVVDSLKYLNNDIKIIFCGNYSTTLKQGLINKIRLKFSPSQQRVYKALSILNSDNRVEMVGMINNVSEMLDATDILISPFTKEHFARPIIEAFARGRTAIGSDVEGMDEIIDHKIDGLIVKKDSPFELATSINFLINNHDLSSEMGEKGRCKVIEKFSFKNVIQIEKIYDELLSSNIKVDKKC